MEQIRWQVIRSHYFHTQQGDNHKLKEELPNATIVPIFFNAWRFEKEEHLIIPLLKTISSELRDYSKADQRWGDRFREAAKQISISAAALGINFTKNFAGRLGATALKNVLGLGFMDFLPLSVSGANSDANTQEENTNEESDNNGSKVVETAIGSLTLEEQLKERFEGELSKFNRATETLDSKYFDFHHQLEKILVGNKGEEPIRLLFLIDDLDRCLPEKAVEMLESIKLFLEVQGTAFVLGVDDEVVERGIAHRYRNYVNEDKQLPITGHEYLEKIITLPIRLDRRDDKNIVSFIKDKNLTQLHALLKESDQLETADDNPQAAANKTQGGNKPDDADTLQKVLKHLPNVPRKIIRLEEMFDYRLNIVQSEQNTELPLEDKLALLRLICIQLMAPDIYRIGQRGEPRIFGFLSDLKQEADDEGTNFEWGAFAQYKHYLEESLNKKITLRQNTSETEPVTEQEASPASNSSGDSKPSGLNVDRETTEKRYIPLLGALDATKKSRSGFDPSTFLTDWDPRKCDYWYQFFGHADPFKGDLNTDNLNQSQTKSTNVDSRWTYTPTAEQKAVFLSALATNSKTQWQSVSRVVGIKRLNEEFATELAPLLKKAFMEIDTPTRLAWLQQNGVLFDAPAFTCLANALTPSSAKTLNDNDKHPFPTQWASLEQMQKVFDDDSNYSPATRLIAGDFIGFLSFGTNTDNNGGDARA